MKIVGIIGLVAVGIILPFVAYPVFLMQALSLAVFACAFNLLLGYGGVLSFGHAAFLGSAAYICGYVAKTWHLPTEFAVLSGTGAAALLGVIYGILATRQRGIYLAMITFALAQLVYFFALELPFTHGEDGLQSIPRGRLFGIINLAPTLNMYYFVLGVTVLSLLLISRILQSPFGQILRAMRDNEQRLVSLGYDVDRFKIGVFTMSAALSGVAGSLKALSLGIVSLGDVYWHVNGEVILMVLLGGLGTQLGPVVGAFLLVTIQHYFAEVGGTVTIIEGCTFATIVLVMRRGIVGELGPILRKIIRRWHAATPRDIAEANAEATRPTDSPITARVKSYLAKDESR